MATMKPFRAIRPTVELAQHIAALPYDVYNRAEAKAEIAKEPDSFLKIDRPETQFPDSVDVYDPRVYEKAKELLWGMVEEGKFIRDTVPGYYIYELVMDGRSQVGISACASIDDYEQNVIKKHENTRAEKEADRIRHVDTCNAQTGPIFLAYRADTTIDAVTERIRKETAPVYDFTAPDGVSHRIWLIQDATDVKTIEQAFAGISEIYIADGHHRAASAVRVGQKRREAHPDRTGEEQYNFFLSVLFPDHQLKILDYNRVVKDLHGLSEEAFLEKVRETFAVEEIDQGQASPQEKSTMGMYLGGKWYRLTIPENLRSDDPVEGLDVSILQKALLSPVLGIEDPKTDARIDFVGGIRGMKELERRCQTDCKVAFSMYPTSIAELFEVADANRLMPPKSTWFEPKLRSGLLIHDLEDEK